MKLIALIIALLIGSLAFAQEYHGQGGSPSFADPVLSAAALPASGNLPGDVRVETTAFGMYIWDGASWNQVGGGGGGGTVTSVALALPAAVFSISGSPVTGAGTLTGSFVNQNANLVFAGPGSGAAAGPTFRTLVGADLPLPSATTLGGIESYASVSHQFITSISTSGVPASAQPDFSDLTGSISASQMLALASADIYVGNGSNQPAAVAMSGDATISNTGALTVSANSVSNAKLAQMPTLTIKGNNTGSTANAVDLTTAQVNTMLGDVTTLGAVGAAPNANGALISGNTLTLEPANGTFPGVLLASDFNAFNFSDLNSLYVAKNGNDITGTGAINRPYLTINKAMSVAAFGTVINVAPGTYAETSISMKPNTWIVSNGNQYGGPTIISVGTGFIDLDASFATTGGRAGLKNISLTGTTGINFDTQSIGGAVSRVFEIDDIQVKGNILFTANGASDFFSMNSGFVFGTTHFSGGTVGVFGSNLVGNVTTDTVGTQGITCVFVSDLMYNNVAVNATGGRTNVTEFNADGLTTFTADGATSSSYLDAVSYAAHASMTLTNGATLNPLNDSYSLSYTPLTSANWNSVPSLLQNSIDTLASSGVVKSQSQNLFLASPNGSSGVPSFRSIVASDLPGGTGTVTSVSVAAANGFSGTVATATTTPAITIQTSVTGLLKGNGTAISAASSVTDYQTPISTFAAPSHQFLTGFTAPNTFTAAQPDFSDLSGSIAASQMLALPDGDIYVGNISSQPASVAMSGDATISNTGALTLSTVNASPGTYTNATIAVNAKGLVTSATSGACSTWNLVSKTSAYTAVACDAVLADVSGGSFTVTLPAAGSNGNACIRIKKVDSSATTVPIAVSGSDTIDGAASASLAAQFNAIEVCSFASSTTWEVF